MKTRLLRPTMGDMKELFDSLALEQVKFLSYPKTGTILIPRSNSDSSINKLQIELSTFGFSLTFVNRKKASGNLVGRVNNFSLPTPILKPTTILKPTRIPKKVKASPSQSPKKSSIKREEAKSEKRRGQRPMGFFAIV